MPQFRTPKLPERERVKAAYWRALDEADSAADGERRLRQLVGELADAGYTAAAAYLADDLDALTAHLRYPLKHRRVWRSTNLLERSLGEVKRRTRVIGRFPGETSCLSLCWAVLDLVISGSNRVRFDDLDRQLIERIAAERCPGHVTEGEEVVAA
ncbi:MAG: transposase [Rhodospirillales bacterium]|nr:transposase [Rhodospirillales bacterium]